ncbi:GNAT family N-acetyltransferase [Streptomyces sp. NPDC005574]|uniref:GNAT family N-acetyltransferase n=1 Tax=Streptomyces sp. NPDC005574 TaxID=3156891 RepID=UPI0033AB6CBE
MDVKWSSVFPPSVRISGHGIELREWSDDDVTELVALYDDPEMARWTPVASPFDTGAALAYLFEARTGKAREHKMQLAVTTDGVRPLGEVLLFRSEADARDVELAYGIGAEHRGQGLAGRAVRLIAAHAARELRPRRVVLRIDPGNAASEGVARSCGFALTADPPVLRVSRGREVSLRTWARTRTGDFGRSAANGHVTREREGGGPGLSAGSAAGA